MARVTLANIPALPTPEWRALCYTDARKCSELLQEFGEQQDHGEKPETWSVPRMLQEARYCLEFYESGSVADRCADGDAEALAERRQLERFIAKWSKLWAQRQALIAKKQNPN